MTGKRVRKILIVTVIGIISLIVLLVLVASPLAGYLVEKYDEKYTGRKIEVGWIFLNPLTGYAHIQNFKLYEKNSNNIFFSAGGITINVGMLKLISKKYEISRFKLKSPRIRIVQNGDKFNFSDLVNRFSKEKKAPDNDTSSIKFSIENIRIQNGEFHYNEKQAPINYFIKNVNFRSEGKSWDADTISGSYSFLSGPGSGSISGNFTFNFKSQDYKAKTVVENFDLKILEQYMREMSNYGHLRATLNASLQSSGNLNDSMNMASKGRIVINDLHFGKNKNEDYFSFRKLLISIREMNLQKGVRNFDTMMLVKPEIKYERYDSLDNIQRMFGEKGEKIDSVKAQSGKFNLVLELADFFKMLSETFKHDYFKIGKFAIEEANIRFSDFSLAEKFTIALNPLNIRADSIDKDNDKIIIRTTSVIEPHGRASAVLSVNPQNTDYFDFSYKFQDIPAPLFNPYLITYTSFPLDRGTIEIHGDWHVKNSVLKSENHFLVLDPRVSEKVRKKDTKWIPMPLIISVIRERGNVIDYEIPITGNLKDPEFKLGDVITDVLKNIFAKPPSTPYIFDVRNSENKVEKSQTIKWEMRTTELLPNQEKFIEKMSGFLEENPEASITVQPIIYGAKEEEHILFFQAKKKYYLTKNSTILRLDEEDSLKVEKMSVKDSSFVNYLDNYLKDSTLFTIQQKCRAYVGEKIVREKYKMLMEKRESAFMKYFRENNTGDRVKILSADNEVPYNGFSYYKISYQGDIPDVLLEAYNKMQEYNSENPRKRYKQWRN